MLTSLCKLNGGEEPHCLCSVEPARTLLKLLRCSQVFSRAGLHSCVPATTPACKKPAKAGLTLQLAASLEHLDAPTESYRDASSVSTSLVEAAM